MTKNKQDTNENTSNETTTVEAHQEIKSPAPAEINNKDYTQLVKETFTLAEKFRRFALQFYWELGSFVLKLVDQAHSKKYGQNLLAKFSSDLFTQYKLKLGTKSLYHAAKVRRTLTKDELELALEGRLGLEDAVRLSKNTVTPELRHKLLEESKEAVQSGKKFDMKNAIQEHTAEPTATVNTTSGQQKQMPRNPLKGVKHMPKFFGTIESKIDMVGPCIEEVCNGSDADRIVAAREAFEESCSAFNNLVDTWKRQRAQAEKALEKVKDIK